MREERKLEGGCGEAGTKSRDKICGEPSSTAEEVRFELVSKELHYTNTWRYSWSGFIIPTSHSMVGREEQALRLDREQTQSTGSPSKE